MIMHSQQVHYDLSLAHQRNAFFHTSVLIDRTFAENLALLNSFFLFRSFLLKDGFYASSSVTEG